MGEVFDDLLRSFSSRHLLQLGEGPGLPGCEADYDFPVDPPPPLPGKIQLLQLGQGGADSSLSDDLLHLGQRAVDKGVESRVNTLRSRKVISEAKLEDLAYAGCDNDKDSQGDGWKKENDSGEKIAKCSFMIPSLYSSRPGK